MNISYISRFVLRIQLQGHRILLSNQNWAPQTAKCKCVLGFEMKTIFWTKSRNGTKTTKIRPLIYTFGPEQERFNYDAAPPSIRDNTALANLVSTCLQCLLKTLTYCKGLECSAVRWNIVNHKYFCVNNEKLAAGLTLGVRTVTWAL